MDTLPHSLLLHILTLLDDSADVARCRVASKAFNYVFPGLRSIKIKCSLDSDSYYESKYGISDPQSLKTVFLDLISKLETVESVYMGFKSDILWEDDDYNITDGDFAKEWLPRVSGSLKSLSLSSLSSDHHSQRQSSILTLISAYCRHLVNLKLSYAWLSVHNLNPMPMLTTLTLKSTRLEDANLSQLNRCFPNLQVLNLERVIGLQDPKIHLLNLKTCVLPLFNFQPICTLITPNLTTFKVVSMTLPTLHVEAPMLSRFHLRITNPTHVGTLILTKFENLKTLWLECSFLGSLLSEFPITKTVENLTLGSKYKDPAMAHDTELTLVKVFTVFPNVASLCIKSSAWSALEPCTNSQGWEILDGRNRLKTFSTYLELDYPSLTFSSVVCVLDQCVSLLEVSLLIRRDVDGTVYERFRSKCMVRWPRLKWRWGLWNENTEDSWITDAISDSTHTKSYKKNRL